jgi:hypothetical protein
MWDKKTGKLLRTAAGIENSGDKFVGEGCIWVQSCFWPSHFDTENCPIRSWVIVAKGCTVVGSLSVSVLDLNAGRAGSDHHFVL